LVYIPGAFNISISLRYCSMNLEVRDSPSV
jgi:hypothetical protein